MERDIRILGVKRKEIDEEKLALAFLLLARTLHENQHLATAADNARPTDGQKAA